MCGLLLMDLGAVLAHDLGGLMYIILPIGFLLLVFGFWQLRQHKQLRWKMRAHNNVLEKPNVLQHFNIAGVLQSQFCDFVLSLSRARGS